MRSKSNEKYGDALSGSAGRVKIISFDHRDFVRYWNEFLKEYSVYSFRYNLETIDYYKMLMSNEFVDNSFIIINVLEDIPIAICPMVICEMGELTTASYGNLGTNFLPCPLFHKKLSKKQYLLAGRTCTEYLEKLFSENHVSRWYSEATVADIDLIQMEETLPAIIGAMDVSIQNQMLSIDVPEADIKTQIRARVRTEINQGLRFYDFKVYDKSNFTFELGHQHRLLHHKSAGRVTRPIGSFHRSYKWIFEGRGLMFEQLYKGQTVNMTLLSLGGKVAYGASTADEPDFEPPSPLMPSMLWTIALELKKRGFIYYETGATNHRDSIHEILTPKEKNIVFFKKGFGDIIFPFKRWIWFSTKVEEVKYLEKSLAKFKAHFLI